MPSLSRRIVSTGMLALAALISANPTEAAGVPMTVQVPICNCAGFVGPHYHLTPPRMGPGYPMNNANNPYGLQGDAGPIYGLPRGRRYYGGRYFGSFNNRFYGPQYGNF